MHILILIVLLNTNVSVTTTQLDSNAACLKAISTALELETDSVKIKARCVVK